jgi:hypothetical protein
MGGGARRESALGTTNPVGPWEGERPETELIQIQLRLAAVALHSASEDPAAAFRADIAGFFVLNPPFGADLFPLRNGSQYDLLADSHGEIFDVSAGKFGALMTAGVALFFRAAPDLALSAMHEQLVRQAATASDIFCGKILAARKSPFSGNLSLVEIDQPLLQFLVAIAVCQVDGTDAAIEATGGNEMCICH